jgi:SAM-dependent MidA family methyltransferase
MSETALQPAPEADAAERSSGLALRIADAIARAGGWIPFDRFMRMALYEPGLGYYSGPARKFGPAGDFVTAPELSPLYGRTLARQIAPILRRTGGDILELGPGTGRLAVDVLRELEVLGALPRVYAMLELSAGLRAQQAGRLANAVPHLFDRVRWLDRLPDVHIGVMLANEVLDAVPVHLVAWTESGTRERGVTLAGGRFAWADRPIASPALRQAAAEIRVEPPYVSEIGLEARALVATLGHRLRQGALLLVDYGFGRAEYYHPQRARGTLVCHYRHRVHDDPLVLPGLQDITSHVDFTAVAEAGVDAGLALLGYTSQGRFLLNCGLMEIVAEVSPEAPARYLPLAGQVNRLTSPAEMGELFKVIALGRRLDEPLIGFRAGDLSRLL